LREWLALEEKRLRTGLTSKKRPDSFCRIRLKG
jgi:hypothetical protein